MIITQTPLRVSLAGGGTDIKEYYSRHGGEVVTMAIDKYIYVVVKKRFDKRIRVGYSRTETVDYLADLQHELVREAMKVCGIEEGIEISTLSDAPVGGTGLGSSSSVTTGVLNALHHYRFRPQPLDVLAQEAVKVEIDILRKPIGKQDHYIAAYGGLCHLVFNRDDSVTVERLQVSDENKRKLQDHLMLLYTGIERSANPILEDLRNNMPSRTKVLDGIGALVPRMRDAICSGDMKEVGRILDENWRLKRGYAKGTTTPELDSLYQRAIEAGAYGGKISGAGGGGFLFICCPPDRRERVRESLGSPIPVFFRIEGEGSKVLLNVRRE